MNNSKNEIRSLIRAKRKSLPEELQKNAAEQVFSHIVHLNRFRMSHHIAFYLSAEGEINPELLLKHAHENGKQCFLPVLHSQKINTLCFLPYKPGDDLVANRFGILEPLNDVSKHFPAWQLDLAFLPLVAFDEKRNRLGMGKGYYDRTFSFIKQDADHKPFLIGLGFQMQQVDGLHTETHDIPLDMIVTEKNILS